MLFVGEIHVVGDVQVQVAILVESRKAVPAPTRSPLPTPAAAVTSVNVPSPLL